MRDPDLASERARSDVIDCEDIRRIYKASGQRYGARKVWHALRREGKDIARCTVERLMRFAFDMNHFDHRTCLLCKLCLGAQSDAMIQIERETL